MEVVVAGGTGQVGSILLRAFEERGDRVIVLSRTASEADRRVAWDGKTLGEWTSTIDGADVVINLAGRSVDCRYTEANLREMMDSRVDSTRVIGEAIAGAKRPPRVWLQMSTATIYAHRFDAPNDEASGILGGGEPDAPAYWARSIAIAKAWEATLDAAITPRTRRVALRTAMVMSPDAGGVFDVLYRMTRAGLGGAIGGGAQYVSFIHDQDFSRAVRWLVDHDGISGTVNLAAPHPLPQREFMATLRDAVGIPIGIPATAWMAEVGAFFLRTDTELLLKSRRVIPTRLLESGFVFDRPVWSDVAKDLVLRRRG